MTDSRLRELKRVWEASGSVEDEAAYLRERVRTGDALEWDALLRASKLDPAWAEELVFNRAKAGSLSGTNLELLAHCGFPSPGVDWGQSTSVALQMLYEIEHAALACWAYEVASTVGRLVPGWEASASAKLGKWVSRWLERPRAREENGVFSRYLPLMDVGYIYLFETTPANPPEEWIDRVCTGMPGTGVALMMLISARAILDNDNPGCDWLEWSLALATQSLGRPREDFIRVGCESVCQRALTNAWVRPRRMKVIQIEDSECWLREQTSPVPHPQKEKILDHLRSGKVMAYGLKVPIDRLSPKQRRITGVRLISDGVWQWDSLVTYYFEHHNLVLPHEFLQHVTGQVT